MVIYLIRHGMTDGNQKKRYIGKTDEPLCQEGRERLKKIRNQALYPRPDLLYVSPMLRCLETAQILFPEMEQSVVEDFRECDFGEFENQNYLELAENKHYQKWIDSNGLLPFPGGESREAFQERSVKALEELEQFWKLNGYQRQTAALVVHGGTIMSILEKTGVPNRPYYDFHAGNGEGYRLEGKDGTYRYEKVCDPDPYL